MTIVYILLLVLTAGFLYANAVDKVKPWAWGLTLLVWLAVLTFAGHSFPGR